VQPTEPFVSKEVRTSGVRTSIDEEQLQSKPNTRQTRVHKWSKAKT